ncbi:hypothetical protein [Actinophytocola algeriensis]|uniref:Uncharacterized protein n=1 Tax=Actinophytocola algeriensis TaxID=1768010 RepID=A0A7W7VF07_9PSEU|nr:hypothetical protein [Actinophytocola algeriensis]MBB4907797.1 hypothetical protein [Actinophytocola algeriensis]MBE1479827.1 hypothetical protein [Actinophytocola algeriensis]
MTVREFLAHRTPGKSRVFAIDTDEPQSLDAVTSLGADDLHRTDSLLDGLNVYLITRDETDLASRLADFPEAVRIGVRDFLARRCAPPPPLGAFGQFGPVERVRLMYLDGDDLEEFVRAAFLVDLGIRLSNEADARGRIDWELELLTEEAVVAPGAEARTWVLPGSAPLSFTWISKFAKGDAVTNAVEAALEASAEGSWVRLHTFEHDGTSEIRVDVFDVPPPVVDQD